MTSAHSIVTNKNSSSQTRSWRRVDIFWSDSDANNWDIEKYYAPTLGLLEKNGVLKRANLALNLRRDKGKPNSQITEYAEKDYPSGRFQGSARAPIEQMLKDAAKVHARGKSDAVVCTEVSQWVIVQVKTYHEITDGDYSTFPNLHVWAFLQPPTIGGDASRREKEMGWVTDDIPRAGWFEAKVVWSQRGKESRALGSTPAFERFQPDGTGKNVVDAVYCDNGSPSAVSRNIPYRLIKNDNGTCTTIQIKLKATIRNDETKEDRERKVGQLKSEVKDKLVKAGEDSDTIEKIIGSIDRYEAGSFLKVWARNLDYIWSPPPTAGDVADDESERCMNVMQMLDSPEGKNDQYIFQNFNNTPPKDGEDTYFRPFSFRNHAWKRNKVVVNRWGEGVGSESAYNSELVYILLLPTEVLEKIDKLFTDDKVATAAKSSENNWILPLSVCISYFAVLSMLRKIKSSQKDPDKFQAVIDAINLPKHAAILASMDPARDKGGFLKSFQDSKLHDVFNGDPASGTFTDSKQKLCQFFAVLFKQAYAIALTWGDGEFDKFVEDYESRQKQFWNSKNSKGISKSLGFGTSDNQLVNINDVFKEVEKTKKLAGTKLPGYFAWLEWAVMLKLGFSLGAQVSFGKKSLSSKEEQFFLNGSLDPKGLVSLAVELGAIWSMTNQEKVQASSEEAWEWAETVKYILTWVELKLGISLCLKSEGKLGFDVNFLSTQGEKIKALFNPYLQIDHKMSLDSQIYATVSNLVQIDYSALHYQIMHLTGSGVSIGGHLYVGGKAVAGLKPYSFVWGIVEAQDQEALFERQNAVLGGAVTVLANYRGQPDPSHYCLDICMEGEAVSSKNYVGVPIFCDEVQRERVAVLGEGSEFPDRIRITNTLAIDDTFFEDQNKKRFLKQLIGTDQRMSGIIGLTDSQFKNDEITKGKTSNAKSHLTILSPSVHINTPGDFSLTETIRLAINISNFSCRIPVYLWVYEDEDRCIYTRSRTSNCIQVSSLKQGNRNNLAGYVSVPLREFRIMDNVRNELSYKVPLTTKVANISFRISLDPEGEFMLKSRTWDGKMLETNAVHDIKV